MRNYKKWLFGLGLLLVAVVTSVYFLGAIKPERPELESKPLSVAPYESSIDVPISVALTRVRELLEASVPSSVSGASSPNIPGNFDRENLSYRANRGPISVTNENDALVLRTSLSGRATIRARHCPGGQMLPCHGIQETGNLAANVTAVLSDIRITPDWRLSASLTPSVDVTKAEVRIVGDLIPISLRSKVEEGINAALPKVKEAFGDFVSQLQVRQLLEKAWADMDHILEVHVAPSVWIVLEPTGVAVAPVTIDNGQLQSAIRLVARVKTVLGARPTDAKAPIPALVEGKSNPGFTLKLPLILSLADLSKAVNECCFPVSVAIGDTSVKLRNVRLSEGAGKLVIGVDFRTGFLGTKGTMYLEGAPYLGADRGTLQVRDLDFDIRTREKLLDGAAELLKPAVLTAIAKQLKLDLRPHYAKGLEELRKRVSELKVGEAVRVETVVERVWVDDIAVGDGKLAVVAAATGVVRVTAQ